MPVVRDVGGSASPDVAATAQPAPLPPPLDVPPPSRVLPGQVFADIGTGTLVVPPPAAGVATAPLPPPLTPAPPPPGSPRPRVPSGQAFIDTADVLAPPELLPAPPRTDFAPVVPPGTGNPRGGDVIEEGDFPDPEEGDGDFTDDALAALEDEADAIDEGRIVLLAATHPAPGTLIGFPYLGTHSHATNCTPPPGPSCNWESMNAVDVWLFPGTHVTAVADGVVSPAGWGYGLSSGGGRFAGWRVHLVASGGRVFYYTHMAALTVAKGQHVRAGDVLGHSGVANGVPHLHFAVNPPFNPAAFYADAFDLHHRTAVGTSPRTGGPPPPSPVGEPASVQQAWHDLLDVFITGLPAAHAKVKALSDGLVEIFK